MARVMLGFGGMMLAAIVGLSFVHPWGDVREARSAGEILAGSEVPAKLKSEIETTCGDCHSNRTHWPVYSRMAPASWLMEHDVHAAREAMNLSEWSGMAAEDRISTLTRIAAEVRSGQMPPKAYTLLHPASRLSDSQKQEIAGWAKTERKRLRSAMEVQKEPNER